MPRHSDRVRGGMTHGEAVCYAMNLRFRREVARDTVRPIGMTPALADRLSTLLAELLVADLRQYPPGTPLPRVG